MVIYPVLRKDLSQRLFPKDHELKFSWVCCKRINIETEDSSYHNEDCLTSNEITTPGTDGTKYSRMDQVKFVKDSL